MCLQYHFGCGKPQCRAPVIAYAYNVSSIRSIRTGFIVKR
jgi:hypothetical protein